MAYLSGARPFHIDVPEEVIDDLHDRVARTRWPDALVGTGWDLGTDLGYLRQLIGYWHDEFDWRAAEARLNELAQVRVEVEGVGIHAVNQRSSVDDAMPLLVLHGWPDSFFRFHKLIPLLSAPEAHGANATDAFHVVAPSLPGYGFSDRPSEPGMTPVRIAHLLVRLMTEELGYERFAVHGGDLGSGISEQLGLRWPDALIGIHLTDVPYWHLFSASSEDLSDAERQYLEAGQRWAQSEGAYAALQGTKPQSLEYALNDSPAGLAGWIIEKLRSWSDCGGDIESRFTKDELLTNLTIYWVTETVGSAARLYYETQHADFSSDGPSRVEVPTNVAIFPKDLVPAPRAFAERYFNIQRWTEMPRGGHFAALEEPELLAEDIRASFGPMRSP